jgi:hypothetical protein
MPRKDMMMSKPEPAVLRLSFQVPADPSTDGSYFIDLSQCASILNRKAFPQGVNWAVAGIQMLTASSSTGLFVVEKLPNTWVMANSWVKAEASWSRMNEKALSEAGSIRPKFLDFKVYADAEHHSQGSAANLLPQNMTAPATAGEWTYSKIVVPDQQSLFSPALVEVAEFELIATGANYPGNGFSGLNAVSLIEGYAASRNLPNRLDPNTPQDATDTNTLTPENWMSAIFNEGTDQNHEVLEDMITENNLAPYPFEKDGTHVDTMYPGGANQLPGLEVHDMAIVSGTTVSSRTRIPGGNFPCGLIKITSTGVSGTYNIFVDLVPGPMRGYLAESMKEMN